MRALVRWYLRVRRDLPWRRTRDPYRIWVSEVLLQQTQATTVQPYYRRFVKAFPSVAALAAASLAAVLKAWEGCGYYARARNLHRAARQIIADGGTLPLTAEQWRQLPGIGRYTAAAIASIAFNEPVSVVDGNVERVLTRLLGERRDVKSVAVQKRLRKTAQGVMDVAVSAGLPPGDVNQALMELGATVCMPRRAVCSQCPLRRGCRARARLTDVTVLPKKRAAKPLPHYDIGAALIRQGGKLLITQRPPHGLLGGLWEFPGGKQHADETLPECVRREIREELGVEIAVGELFARVRHAYSHFHITLHVYECRLERGRLRRIGVADFRWVLPRQLNEFAFPKADRVIIERLHDSKSIQ